MKQQALPIIENVLAESLALKARVERQKLRQNISRKVYAKQEKMLHDRIVTVLAPLFEEQIRETAKRLLELAPGEKHLQGRHNQLSHGRGGGGGGTRKSPINESKQKIVQDALGMVNDKTISLLEKNGIRIVDSDRTDVGRASYLKYQGVIAIRKGGVRHSIYSEDRAAEPIDVVHEMGHAVDASLASKIPVSERTFDQNTYWSEKALPSTLKADEKAMKPKKPGPSWEDPVESWSYAYGSPEEAFSACFAAVHGNDERHNGFSIRDAMPKTYAAVSKKLKSNGISPRKHVSGDNKKYLANNSLPFNNSTKAPTTSTPLLPLAFDANDPRWKNEMIDRLLPEMARSMLEAMHAQMIEAGVNPAKTKHLQGRHNQLSHGRGGGGSSQPQSIGEEMVPAVRKGKQWVTQEGEPVPKHVGYIPPGWRNVRVNLDPNADMVASGVDSKGRNQANYSKSHGMKAAAAKFARTAELRRKQKEIRKEMDKDVKNPKLRERASCARLIQATGLRPGSERDTLADKKAYGATTLEGRHVSVRAGNVRLKFTGKKGVSLDLPVDDPVVAKDLVARKKAASRTGKLFDTDEGQVLSYNKSKDGGGFKTKDFRTAKGTNTAVDAVKRMPKPGNQKEYKEAVKKVAKQVSTVLGNTPAVALQSYIDPAVFAGWRGAT